MKVLKTNFVPLLKVESNVLRIKAIYPLSKINFIKRICFSRKNKTLRALFKQYKTFEIIYKNYK